MAKLVTPAARVLFGDGVLPLPELQRLAHAGDPRAAAVATELAERLSESVEVHRGVLGFTYLVLSR